MKISDKGLALIKEHEGLRLEAYLCPAGVPTIGWGHTRTAKLGQRITEAEADLLLRQDVAGAERTVSGVVPPLSQNRFDALVSFVFNLGTGNFQHSTLRRKVVSNPDDPTIEEEFNKWVNGGGKRLPGLVKRRAAEAKLYFS